MLGFVRTTVKGWRYGIVASKREINFDYSLNPNKIEDLQPNTTVEVDGAFNRLPNTTNDAGTGVLVTSLDGGFKEFGRKLCEDAVEKYGKDDCCSVAEYVAVRDGVEFALQLLGRGKVSPPLVIHSDHLSTVSNAKKVYYNEPSNMIHETRQVCDEICELLSELPPQTSVVWRKGTKIGSHLLADSLINGEESLGKNKSLQQFYDKNFSFKVRFVRPLVEWVITLCDLYKIDRDNGVLDVGTGNGLLLQEWEYVVVMGYRSILFDFVCFVLFSDLCGIDLSESVLGFAQGLAEENGHDDITFLVDDVIHSKLDRQFQLVLDSGTLDSFSSHPNGDVKRLMYWESLASLVAQGGMLVLSSFQHQAVEGPFLLLDTNVIRGATVIACLRL